MSRSRPRFRTAVPAIGLLLALGACVGTTASPTPTSEPDPPSPSASGSVEPSRTAEASTEPSPSEAPSAAVTATPGGGGGLTVAPNPQADTLFLDRDQCENRRDGYQVQFPEVWFTNTEYRDFAPCVWFSPDFYTVEDDDDVPDEIAITIEWVPGDTGSFEELMSREEVNVGFQPAVRTEWAGAEGNGGQQPPEWREYRYVIQLGRTPEEGPNLLIRTATDMGGDYELNKAVLDRMMTTMEFIGSTQ